MELPSSSLQLPLNLNIRPLQLLPHVSSTEERETDCLELAMSSLPREDVRLSALEEKLNRVNEENKKLNERLVAVCESYNSLRSHLVEILSKNCDKDLSPFRKRKLGGGDDAWSSAVANTGVSESSSTDNDRHRKKPREGTVKGKIVRVCVRTESTDTGLILKDGYQWRKYGQKITRDNPSPRAYFRCSYAPTCPVKKKVQRSMEEASILVATYDGEHNHPKTPRSEAAAEGTPTASKSFLSLGPASALSKSLSRNLSMPTPPRTRTPTLNLMKSETTSNTIASRVDSDPTKLHTFFVEQMASFLTNDPSFTAALATAISGKRTAVATPPTEES